MAQLLFMLASALVGAGGALALGWERISLRGFTRGAIVAGAAMEEVHRQEREKLCASLIGSGEPALVRFGTNLRRLHYACRDGCTERHTDAYR